MRTRCSQRRLYGSRTERSHTSELQRALGDLLAGEVELQKALDDAVGKVRTHSSQTGPRLTPRDRRDLSLSKLPRVVPRQDLRAAGAKSNLFEADAVTLVFQHSRGIPRRGEAAKLTWWRDVERRPGLTMLGIGAVLDTNNVAPSRGFVRVA